MPAIEIWRVNWSDTAQRVLMRSGSIGEVRRSGPAFAAEVRGLAHYLQQPKGRLFQYGCDADLGDAPLHRRPHGPRLPGTGIVVTASSLRLFTASGLGSFAADWFTRGLVTFTSGANAGRAQEVQRHGAGSRATLELWQPMAQAIAPGDTFIVTAGCDKQFATCRPSSPTRSTSAASRTCPATTSSPPSPAPATPANDGALPLWRCQLVSFAKRNIAGPCTVEVSASEFLGPGLTADDCTVSPLAMTRSPNVPPRHRPPRPHLARHALPPPGERAAASAPIASASSAASIASSTAARRRRRPPTRATGPRPPARRRCSPPPAATCRDRTRAKPPPATSSSSAIAAARSPSTPPSSPPPPP